MFKKFLKLISLLLILLVLIIGYLSFFGIKTKSFNKLIEEKITKDESAWRQPGEHSSGPLSCFDSADNTHAPKHLTQGWGYRDSRQD